MDSDGLEILMRAMGGESQGDIIEDQEARGQRNFCESETLPCSASSFNEWHDTRVALEDWGIVFDDGPLKDDPLFIGCILPDGWKKVATDHSMHSDLVDDKGRKRAGIFYKAAFYDKKAHISLNRRFNIHSQDYDVEKETCKVIHEVQDCDTVVFTSDAFEFPEEYSDGKKLNALPDVERSKVIQKHSDADDLSRKQCEDWLNEAYPEWKDCKAYWN